MPLPDPPEIDVISAESRHFRLSSDWSITITELQSLGEYQLSAKLSDKLPCEVVCRLGNNGQLTILAGFTFDGCSSPVGSGYNTPPFIPCLVHDVLGLGADIDPDCPWSKKTSDDIFKRLMAEYRVNPVQRWVYHRGVRPPFSWAYRGIRAAAGLFGADRESHCD